MNKLLDIKDPNSNNTIYIKPIIPYDIVKENIKFIDYYIDIPRTIRLIFTFNNIIYHEDFILNEDDNLYEYNLLEDLYKILHYHMNEKFYNDKTFRRKEKIQKIKNRI